MWHSGSTLRPCRRPRELTTVYGVSCAGSTLGTRVRLRWLLVNHSGHSGAIERSMCRRPHPMSPSKLMLVLDDSRTGGERTVVLDVLRTHTRTRNTCNEKSGVGGPPRAGPRHRCVCKLYTVIAKLKGILRMGYIRKFPILGKPCAKYLGSPIHSELCILA